MLQLLFGVRDLSYVDPNCRGFAVAGGKTMLPITSVMSRRKKRVSETSAAAGGQQEALKLDTNVPQTARIWNYWLPDPSDPPDELDVFCGVGRKP